MTLLCQALEQKTEENCVFRADCWHVLLHKSVYAKRLFCCCCFVFLFPPYYLIWFKCYSYTKSSVLLHSNIVYLSSTRIYWAPTVYKELWKGKQAYSIQSHPGSERVRPQEWFRATPRLEAINAHIQSWLKEPERLACGVALDQEAWTHFSTGKGRL